MEKKNCKAHFNFHPKENLGILPYTPLTIRAAQNSFFYSETEIEAYQQIGELTPVICNGAMGWKLVFKSKRHQCAEYHFDIKDDEKSNIFIIRIETSAKDKDISDILRHEAVTELLSSIKTE